jgi:hypothetical protein
MLQKQGLFLIRKTWRELCFTQSTNFLALGQERRFLRTLGAAAAVKTKPPRQTWRKARRTSEPLASNVVVSTSKDSADFQAGFAASNVNADPPDTEIDDSTANNSTSVSAWVPPAYRGIELNAGKTQRGPESLTSRQKRSGRHRNGQSGTNMVKRHGRVDSRKGEAPLLVLPERAAFAKQEKEEIIVAAVDALVPIATSYRKYFHGDDVDGASNGDTEGPTQTFSKTVEHRITSALRLIHSGKVLDREQILKSEPEFRSICRFLQQICSTTCSLSTLWRYNDTDAIQYIDLSEFIVRELVRLSHDRSNVWTGIQPNSAASKSRLTLDESQETKSRTELAEDSATLLSMKRLLKNVLTNLASTASQRDLSSDSESAAQIKAATNTEEQSECETVGRRMLNLLDYSSTVAAVDAETVEIVMETLCRLGTLSSARMCNKVYLQYTSKECRIQFPLVLEAYRRAVNREKDQEALLDLVEEVLNLLIKQWNGSWPTHRVERTLQVSVVLSCMAEAGMGKVAGMCDTADLLLRRALGINLFTQFFQEVHSDKPKVDNHTIAIANALAQLYASSGRSILLETAKKLLKYMMTEQEDALLLAALYPTVEACNAVLFGLAQPATERDTKMSHGDFDFARTVLDFMFSRNGTACFPNSTTYDLMFTLLESWNPIDIGIIGEDLLSTIETNNLLCGSSSFSLPFSTYQRILQYWLQMVKNGYGSIPASRIGVVPFRRATHLLRKLEVRSTAMIMHADTDFTVKNLYDYKLRPMRNTYLVVLQICAFTSAVEDQDEAARIAVEIYQCMVTRKYHMDDLSTLLENCPNRKVIELITELA